MKNVIKILYCKIFTYHELLSEGFFFFFPFSCFFLEAKDEI